MISSKLLIQEVMILQFKVTSLKKKVGELGHTNKTILQELRDLKTFMMPSSMLQNNENSSSSSSALQSLNSAETQVINLIITNPNPESFLGNIKNLDILTVMTRWYHNNWDNLDAKKLSGKQRRVYNKYKQFIDYYNKHTPHMKPEIQNYNNTLMLQYQSDITYYIKFTCGDILTHFNSLEKDRYKDKVTLASFLNHITDNQNIF